MLISIFCEVIDNFGDIGVCYRLAKNLIKNNIQVNLYINDLHCLAKIIPLNIIEFDVNLKCQKLDNIQIIHWQNDVNDTIEYDNADKIINAFACKLPSIYQQTMPKNIVWIQLDYLALGKWAKEYHGLYAYIHQHKRYFFTPSFYPNTGGLLTNDFHLIQDNDKQSLMHKYNIQKINTNIHIFIFAYINQNLLDSLVILQQFSHVKIFMPISVYVNLPKPVQINITPLDFCSQNDFDNLLQVFDILWVRGEDSFIRAQLANKPLIWQAYIQEEDNEHFNKVNCFLDLYLSYFKPYNQIIKNLWQSINGIIPIRQAYFIDYLAIFNQKEFVNGLEEWNKYLNHLPKLEDEIMNFN